MVAAERPDPVGGPGGVLPRVAVGEECLAHVRPARRRREHGPEFRAVAQAGPGGLFRVDPVVDLVLPGKAGDDVRAELRRRRCEATR